MKRFSGRFQAILLTVVMIGALFGMPMTASAAPPPVDDHTLLYYNFEDVNSTIVEDASGNGKIGTIRNFDKGGAKIVDDNIYGAPVKALELPGGAEGGYLEMPAGILGARDAVTITAWVKLTTNTAYQRIWDFGNNTTSYFYLLSDGNNAGARGYAAAVTLNGWQSEQAAEKSPAPSNIAKNRWVLTTVVLDGNDDATGSALKLYENGQLVAERETTVTLGALGLTGQNFLGKGQFADPPTKGRFAEVAVIDHAMTDAEIAAMYDVDAQAYLNDDASALNPGDLSTLIADFTLPVKGVNGSDITWTSANPAIAIEGAAATVTRPAAGQKNATGKLTATLSYEGLTATASFDAVVLAQFTDKQMAQLDAEALDLGDTAGVYRNLNLPATGSLWGSVVLWDSSDEAVISRDGKVKRPDNGEGNVKVTLTATVRKGGQWVNRTFECTVLEKQLAVSITSVAAVDVTTQVGYAPILPNIVEVTYSDDSKADVKAVWPATIPAANYASAGTFKVNGRLIGADFPFQANVTVVETLTEEHILKSSLFDLSDVSLDNMGVRLKANQGRAVEYMKVLDSDRMLYNFRNTFGQDTLGAQAISGWDSATGLLRGHSTGHFMTALSLAYASTGDPTLKTKIDYMITEMRKLQVMSQGVASEYDPPITVTTPQSQWGKDPSVWGKGFISAYAPDHFVMLEIGGRYGTNDIWAPYYTLHKLMQGFIDSYRYAGNEEGLEAAKELGLWVYDRLSGLTQQQLSTMWATYIAGEFGGFNESMAMLYDLTGDDRYLAGAKLFDNTSFFNDLSKNIDSIRTKHANQHIPQITGALKIYEGTLKKGQPEEYYYDVANNFWHMVASRYAYSIGGVGTGEMFREPYRQAEFISGTNCETCAAYNLLKLTKDLYKYAPDDPEYMDYYERTLLNQIISSQRPETTATVHNGTTYHFPIGPGQTRSYSNDYTSFTCCHGTGMENHLKYQEAAYYYSGDNLYVNLYIPTTLNWEEKGLTVKQETNFPSENTKLTVSGAGIGAVDVKLRVPYWATDGFTVKLNGETKFTKPRPSGYITLPAVKSGDVIEINMPFTYRLDRTPDQLNGMDVASVMYGPLVMVTRDTSTAWKNLSFQKDLTASITNTGTDGAPALTTNGLSFVPLYEAHNYAYHTYFRVTQSNEEEPVRYDVVLPASPANGTITSSALRVDAGEDVTIFTAPAEGYRVSNLTVGGESVAVRADGSYVVRNVTGTVTVGVTFGPVGSGIPMPNPAELHRTATPTAHYTASWERLDRVNLTTTPASSAPGTGNGWGNWDRAQREPIWISYTWGAAVTMNQFRIYWYDDNGGTRVPSNIQIQYLDNLGAWKTVTNMSPLSDANRRNQFNTITFDPVTTSQVRINILSVTNNAAGTGILRWWVSNSVDKAGLASTIADAVSMTAADYTLDSYQGVLDAVEAADLVMEADSPTAEEVLSAMQAIFMAKQALLASPVKLETAVTEAEAIDTDGYTADSVSILADEIANAKAIITLMTQGGGKTVAEMNGTITQLQKATDGLRADKTPLLTVVKEARLVQRGDYLADSFAAFEEAYLAAEDLLTQANPTKQAVVKAAADLTAAFGTLEEVDRSDLSEAYASYAALIADEKAYTAASWDEFKTILDYAGEVLDDLSYTQADVNQAIAWLKEAAENLTVRPAVGYLENQIARGEGIIASENPAQYTEESWTALTGAVAEAKDVRANLADYDDTEIYAAAAAVFTAIDTLSGVGGARQDLIYWVEIADAYLADAGKYIPAAVTNLTKIRDEANTLLGNPSSTDAAMEAKTAELRLAIFQMYAKGNKAELQTLFDLLSTTYTQSSYTTSSWAVFDAALTEAEKVLNNVNAIDDAIAKATTVLLEAEAQLSKRASYSQLNVAIAQAETIVASIGDYVASSVLGISSALTKAKAVAANPDAIQAQADAARDTLREAIGKARLKPDKSPLLNALNAAKAVNTALYTAASVKILTALTAQGDALMAKPDESVNQAEIDSLAKGINDAIKGLIPVAGKTADTKKKDAKKSDEKKDSGKATAGTTGKATANEKKTQAASAKSAGASSGSAAVSTGTAGNPSSGDAASDVKDDATAGKPVVADSDATEEAAASAEIDGALRDGKAPNAANTQQGGAPLWVVGLIALALLIAGGALWMFLVKGKTVRPRKE